MGGKGCAVYGRYERQETKSIRAYPHLFYYGKGLISNYNYFYFYSSELEKYYNPKNIYVNDFYHYSFLHLNPVLSNISYFIHSQVKIIQKENQFNVKNIVVIAIFVIIITFISLKVTKKLSQKQKKN